MDRGISRTIPSQKKQMVLTRHIPASAALKELQERLQAADRRVELLSSLCRSKEGDILSLEGTKAALSEALTARRAINENLQYTETVLREDRTERERETLRLKTEIDRRRKIQTATDFDMETEDIARLSDAEVIYLWRRLTERRKSLQDALSETQEISAASDREVALLRQEGADLSKAIKAAKENAEFLGFEASTQAAELRRLSERIQSHRELQRTARNHIETQIIAHNESWSSGQRPRSTARKTHTGVPLSPNTMYFPSILRSFKSRPHS